MAGDETAPVREEVELEIGARVYRASFKIKALMMLQAHYRHDGEPPPDINAIIRLAKQGSIEHRIAMFWASLQKYQPDVTFDQATDLIDDLGGIVKLEAMFSELDQTLLPEEEDGKELEESAREAGSEAAAGQVNPSEAQADGSIGESSGSAPVESV